jgi:hypothetical protein
MEIIIYLSKEKKRGRRELYLDYLDYRVWQDWVISRSHHPPRRVDRIRYLDLGPKVDKEEVVDGSEISLYQVRIRSGEADLDHHAQMEMEMVETGTDMILERTVGQ